MDLGRFLRQRDVIYTLCAASISTQIVIIADLVTQSCVLPFFDKKTTDGSSSVESFAVDVRGAKIELGKLFIAIIRLIIVTVILFLIYYLAHW